VDVAGEKGVEQRGLLLDPRKASQLPFRSMYSVNIRGAISTCVRGGDIASTHISTLPNLRISGRLRKRRGLTSVDWNDRMTRIMYGISTERAGSIELKEVVR
jgi:hypothetical protein